MSVSGALLQPSLVVWVGLLGLGLFLLVAGQPLGRPRPELSQRLRRLDIDERLRLNAAAADEDIGLYPDPLARQPIARLFWPLASRVGRRLLGLLRRVGL